MTMTLGLGLPSHMSGYLYQLGKGEVEMLDLFGFQMMSCHSAGCSNGVYSYVSRPKLVWSASHPAFQGQGQGQDQGQNQGQDSPCIRRVDPGKKKKPRLGKTNKVASQTCKPSKPGKPGKTR